MAEPWLKLDVGIITHPKVMGLTPAAFKAWVCCLCIAKQRNDGGRLPRMDRIAFAIHVQEVDLAPRIEALITVGLIDREGDTLMMHDWEHWQRPKPSESRDAWAERQRRHRSQNPDGYAKTAENGPLHNHLDGVTPSHDVTGVTESVTPVTPIDKKRTEKMRKEEKGPPVSPPRGARIPADLSMTDDMLAYAREHGVNERRAHEHFAEYRLYWGQATKNATSRDWRARWKTSLARDIREGRLRPDLALALTPADEPEQTTTPAEVSYREMVGAILGKMPEGAVSERTEAVVVRTLGGWDAVKGNLPGYPAWLTAWNSTE